MKRGRQAELAAIGTNNSDEWRARLTIISTGEATKVNPLTFHFEQVLLEVLRHPPSIEASADSACPSPVPLLKNSKSSCDCPHYVSIELMASFNTRALFRNP